MRRLVCSLVIVLAARTAHGEPRCIGPAIPGALVGGAGAGPLVVIGSLELAGYDLNRSQHETAIIGGSMVAGAIAGPIAACAAFSDEPHAVPAASFVVGGAIVGGVALGGATFAAIDPHTGPCPPGRSCGGNLGEAIALSTLALTAGAVAGGFGGYYLHVRVFGNEQPMVAPIGAPGMAALVVAGRF